MINIVKYIFIILVCSLLLAPSANAENRDVKVDCFTSKHRNDPNVENACRIEKDLFINRTQNVVLECDSFVDFDDRAGFRAYAQLSLQVGSVTKQRTSKRGPDSEPQKNRTKLSIYWDGEVNRGVQRFSCSQENQYGVCLQTRMCIYH